MQQLGGAFDEGAIKRKNITTQREGAGPEKKIFLMRHRAISYADRSFLSLANQRKLYALQLKM